LDLPICFSLWPWLAGVRSLDAGIIGYIEPVLNPVWVFLFIGERPSGWAIVGGLIIIVSVLSHTIIEARARAGKNVAVELSRPD
jgi:drug/metabolite transporter (DMT)-like permease